MSYKSATYRHINFEERRKIEQLYSEGFTISKIAYYTSRNRSTISREVERNGFENEDGTWCYIAGYAQRRYEERQEFADRRKFLTHQPDERDVFWRDAYTKRKKSNSLKKCKKYRYDRIEKRFLRTHTDSYAWRRKWIVALYARKRDYRTEELQRLENYSIGHHQLSSFKTYDLLGSSYDWHLRYSLCTQWGGWRYGSLCWKRMPSRSKWLYDKRLREPVLQSGRIKSWKHSKIFKREYRNRFKSKRRRAFFIPPRLTFEMPFLYKVPEAEASHPLRTTTASYRAISNRYFILPADNQLKGESPMPKPREFTSNLKIPAFIYEGSSRALLKSA